jgi:hypothetical protein
MWKKSVTLENHTRRALVWWKMIYKVSINENLTLIWLRKPGYNSQQGCLPTTARAKQSNKLTISNDQTYLVEGYNISKSLGYVSELDRHAQLLIP